MPTEATQTNPRSVMTELITPTKGMGYTDLYLDFVSGNQKATGFFASDDLNDIAARVSEVNYDRSQIVSILKRQNERYGAGQATRENIEALQEKSTLCVCAGQQAVLFGGPLLIILKALSLVKSARLYSKQLGQKVIPIFWIAADDHDFAEANHMHLLNQSGVVERIEYDSAPENEVPMAQVELNDEAELKRIHQQFRDLLGETDFTAEINDLLNECYAAGETLASAFGKLIIGLCGRFGLVVFSPGDDEAKLMAAPLFKAIVRRQDDIHKVITDTNQRIRESGYHIQVEKKENATHLFYNDNGRRPVHREDDRFIMGELSLSKDDLLKLIDTHPERFSPDVMTRPILQSYLFPVLSQKGGPSEIAYLAQINGLFDLFDLVTPVHRARPSATFVERRFEKLMNDFNLSMSDLNGDIEQAINRILAETFPADIESDFEQLRKDVQERFNCFRDRSLTFDKGLESFAKQTLGKIDFSLKNFESKVFSTHKKKSQATRDRVYRLWHALYPERGLQERTLSIFYFLARYGIGFIDFILERVDSEETAHQMINLSEMNDK